MRSEIVEQGPAIVQHPTTETQQADVQAAWVPSIQDTRLPIGPDFPGDLSTQRFQDPFDENLDGGLWEGAGAGLAFGNPIRGHVELW